MLTLYSAVPLLVPLTKEYIYSLTYKYIAHPDVWPHHYLGQSTKRKKSTADVYNFFHTCTQSQRTVNAPPTFRSIGSRCVARLMEKDGLIKKSIRICFGLKRTHTERFTTSSDENTGKTTRTQNGTFTGQLQYLAWNRRAKKTGQTREGTQGREQLSIFIQTQRQTGRRVFPRNRLRCYLGSNKRHCREEGEANWVNDTGPIRQGTEKAFRSRV